jgi:DnaJ-class molecular chaperone
VIAPYVTLDRPGLVHEVCPNCRGDGKSEAWFGDACRETQCTCCAGRGYVVTEAPEPKPDGSDDGLCTRFYPSVEGEDA